MPQYRIREKINAVQWFPGTDVDGVTEGKTAAGDVIAVLDTGSALNSCASLAQGDYVVFSTVDPTYMEYHTRLKEPAVYRRRMSAAEFNDKYEPC